MQAKDTVMSDTQLEEKIRVDYKDFRVADESGYNRDILIWTREYQAEISFKAGAQELANSLIEVKGLDGIHYWVVTNSVLKAKLKEWGLEGGQ